MNAALLIARLLLALVFTVAGAAKLADRQGSRQAIVDFGVPSAIAAPLGLVLPSGRTGRRCKPCSRRPRLGGGLWGRWRSSRCS